jgi:hypothetical protein
MKLYFVLLVRHAQKGLFITGQVMQLKAKKLPRPLESMKQNSKQQKSGVTDSCVEQDCQ